MQVLNFFYLVLIWLIIAPAAIAGGHSEIEASGKTVFEASCANCHDSLIGGFFSGAPKIGKQADWAPLMPKGIEGLTQATISGIGKMKPRGDCTECSDAEIRSAVEYIVQQSR
jgi:cytochrome c5